MDEHGEQCREQVFEIFWRQHDPEDWVAVVKDIFTDQRRQVCSWEELEGFIKSQLPIARLQEVE